MSNSKTLNTIVQMVSVVLFVFGLVGMLAANDLGLEILLAGLVMFTSFVITYTTATATAYYFEWKKSDEDS